MLVPSLRKHARKKLKLASNSKLLRDMEVEMFGIGLLEVVLIIVVLGMVAVGLALLYWVVRAAVRAGIRDRKPPE